MAAAAAVTVRVAQAASCSVFMLGLRVQRLRIARRQRESTYRMQHYQDLSVQQQK